MTSLRTHNSGIYTFQDPTKGIFLGPPGPVGPHYSEPPRGRQGRKYWTLPRSTPPVGEEPLVRFPLVGRDETTEDLLGDVVRRNGREEGPSSDEE